MWSWIVNFASAWHMGPCLKLILEKSPHEILKSSRTKNKLWNITQCSRTCVRKFSSVIKWIIGVEYQNEKKIRLVINSHGKSHAFKIIWFYVMTNVNENKRIIMIIQTTQSIQEQNLYRNKPRRSKMERKLAKRIETKKRWLCYCREIENVCLFLHFSMIIVYVYFSFDYNWE